MKLLLNTLALAVAVAAPAISFAQSQQPVTRADVRNEFLQLRAAGFNPRDAGDYPDNLQAAEARLTATRDASAPNRGSQDAMRNVQ